MSEIVNIQPKLGEGIYLTKDIAKILHLDYEKVYRWLGGYWSGNLDNNYKYTFGEPDNRAINFLSLIEFYTFYKLREKGVSATAIRKLHNELSGRLRTPYPFAIAQDYFVEKKKTRKTRKTFIYYTYLDSIIRLDKKNQFVFSFITKFLEKIEFDENNIAIRFYPLSYSRNVVVDPKHQFGQPIIAGTNIRTQTLFNLYKGGETIENISTLYNIHINKVKDAISFQEAA